MDLTFITRLSATLFFGGFVMHLSGTHAKDSRFNTQALMFLPFAIIFAGDFLLLPVTDFALFKWAILVYQFMVIAHFLILHKQTTTVSLSIGILASMALIFLLAQNWFRPIEWLNIALLITAFVTFFLYYRRYRQTQIKQHKEYMESQFFIVVGAFVMSLSNEFYIMTAGVILIQIYQISKLIITFNHAQSDLKTKLNRLNDLEHKFNRVVEFESRKRTTQMADHVAYIKDKAQRDPLTKALNRQSTVDAIRHHINAPDTKFFSIAFFDIDSFKTINDTLGHTVGDEALINVSNLFMSRKRKTDDFGRYGGDEFILILPGVNAPMAIEICDRLREEVSKTTKPKITISMGIATYPYDGRTPTELLEVADKGLYKIKETGKNQVGYSGNVPIIQKF